MYETLPICGGLILGFAIAWFIGGKTREQLVELKARFSIADQQLKETQIALTATKADLTEATNALHAQSALRAAAEALGSPDLEDGLEELRRIAAERQAEISQLQARTEEQAKSSAEKLRLLTDAESSLSNAFKALSAEALKSNNQNFLQLATASLEKFQEKAKGDLEARQKEAGYWKLDKHAASTNDSEARPSGSSCCLKATMLPVRLSL